MQLDFKFKKKKNERNGKKSELFMHYLPFFCSSGFQMFIQ